MYIEHQLSAALIRIDERSINIVGQVCVHVCLDLGILQTHSLRLMMGDWFNWDRGTACTSQFSTH